MAYKIINGAYFEETPQGFAAVADPTTLSKLRSGELTASAGSLNAPVVQPNGLGASGQQAFQSTLKGTLPSTSAQPQNRGSLMSFATALQNVSELVRQKRNEAGLGVVADTTPRGGLPNFSGILGVLNRAGSQFTEGLTTSALDIQKEEMKMGQEKKQSLQNLALSASKAGAGKDIIESILSSDNIEDAIRVSSGAFAKSGENIISTTTRVDQVGNKYADIVKVGADGKMKTESVLLGQSSSSSDVDTETVDTYARAINKKQGDAGYMPVSSVPSEIRDAVLKRAEEFKVTPEQASVSSDVGVDPVQVARDVSLSTAPQWFITYVNNYYKSSLQPSAVQAEWDTFKNAYQGGSSDEDNLF